MENPAAQEFSEHALLEKYCYLVKRAVQHLRAQVTSSFDEEDFYQIGLMGLLEAARRYGSMDEGFPGFAFTRIRGAILDELRRLDWRPRSLRQAVHKLKNKERELARKLQRDPTETELANYVNLSKDKVRELLEAEADQTIDSFDDWMGETLAGNSEEDHNNLAISMAKIFDQLPERDRLIVHLYYYEGLNMKEIALALDLTEPRVSQIHKGVLSKIKTMM